MRDDDPRYRTAAEMRGKDALPSRFGFGHRVAAIDNCPTGPVFEQPQIDVVEREGQRHAQPQDSGCYGHGIARPWRRRNRKAQRPETSIHDRSCSRVRIDQQVRTVH
jgi:hypothetical protein